MNSNANNSNRPLDAAELEALMRSRRSVRRFKPEPIPPDIVDKLIEMAITAPSASNKQPWRFFIIEDPDIITRLATEVRQANQKIKNHIEPEFIGAYEKYGDYFTRFEKAPLLIVPIFSELLTLSHLLEGELPEPGRTNVETMEFNSGLVSVSLAIGNILLYAHALGLGASCMSGPMVALDKIKEILKIPVSWHMAAMIALGYPEETPAPVERKSAGSVIRRVGARPDQK